MSSAGNERRGGSACSVGSDVRTILDVGSLNLQLYFIGDSDIEPLQILIYL